MATDANVLKSFSCFRDLSDTQLNAIAAISNSVCYMPGHVLFEEGDQGDLLYLLIEGDVEVLYKSDETGLNRVDTISCEEVVGCSAMVPPYTYSATEKCLNEVEVLEIKTDELRELIEEDPKMGLKLQQYIIQTLNDRIIELRKRAYGLALE